MRFQKRRAPTTHELLGHSNRSNRGGRLWHNDYTNFETPTPSGRKSQSDAGTTRDFERSTVSERGKREQHVSLNCPGALPLTIGPKQVSMIERPEVSFLFTSFAKPHAPL